MVTDYVPGYGLPSQPSPPPPITESAVEIANAYQQLFGRAADDAGAQYWAGTGLTGQELINAMGAGAQGADIQAYQAYKQKAPPPATGISGLLTTPPPPTTQFIQPEKVYGTAGFTAQQVRDYIEANKDNNLQGIVNAANQYGISAEDIKQATGYTGQDMAQFMANKNALTDADVFTNYGNTKFTTAKQDKASDFAEKYLGTSELTPDQLNFIAQNYTGTNLENTVKLLAEQEKTKQAYQSALGRDPTAEELATATKKYNWKNIGEGITSNIGSQVITGDPTIDYVINQAYKTQLGREGDTEGVNYWKGELAKGNITLNQFNKMFGEAAEEDLIESAYKDMFGREADQEGLDYWKKALSTTNKEDIYKALQAGATGTDLLALSNYLSGQGQSGNEFVKKYLEAEDNLMDEYESFRKYGIDPTLAGADYFSKVGDSYNTYTDTTINDILGTGAASQMSAETKQNIVDNLLAGNVTREELVKTFQESGANKNQEASRIANLYVQAFGGDAEDAKALYAKLTGATYTGTGKVDPEIYNRAKEKFDKALTSESEANAGITSLIKEAANTSGAETRKFFTDNPDLLTVYKDVGETKAFSNAGTGGQYGYYKGIPVLKASEVDEVFDKMGTDYIQGNAPDRLDNDIGWDTGSLSAVEARGAAALGVRKQDGGTDPETGQTYPATYTGDMTKLAAQLGIDPTKYKDTYKTVKTIDPETGRETEQQVIDKRAEDQLYDALNEKAKDFYFIAGKTGSGKTNDRGETSAFTRNDVSGNHAAVLYKKVGDKLIPIEDTLKYYNGQMELSPGSWFSQTFGGLASIPGIAELSLLIPGVGPGTYAAIKAAQTAALGGDLGDVAKAGALSYAGAKYLPTVTSGISEGLSGAGVTNELLNKTLTGATVSGGIAGLTGKDIGPAALMGGAGGALSYGASNLVPKEGLDFANQLGIDPKYQSLFANTLARLTPTILTGGKVDPTKVLMAYMMNQAKGAAKQQVKEGTT